MKKLFSKGASVSPRKIKEMDEKEFDEYIKSAKEGEISENDEEFSGEDLNFRKRVEEIEKDWQNQADIIKKIDPEFDINKAFENPEFYELVVNGQKSLAEAYHVLKKNTPRRSIKEVGNLSNGVGGYVRRDVNSMTDKEFDEYIKKIKNR